MSRSLLCALAIVLSGATGTVSAGECPPPLEFSQRKSALLPALRGARDPDTARFLTRSYLALFATAPDQKAQALLDRGLTLRARGDLKGAAEVFGQLIAYCPGYAEGYSQRASVHYLRGHNWLALADLTAALARAPEHLAALAAKGTVLTALGRVREGQAALRRAMEINPWLPERSVLIIRDSDAV